MLTKICILEWRIEVIGKELNSRTEKSKVNIIIGMSCKIITLILTFVGRKIFIQNIGIDYLGINSLFSNILSLLSLADLGFGTAMSYSFYQPLADNNRKKIMALINFYKKIYNIIAVLIGSIGVIIIPFLQFLINMETNIHGLYYYYILFLINTVVSYMYIYKSILATADQKGYVVNLVTACANILKTIFQIIAIYIWKSYAVYLVIMIIFTLVNNLTISKYVNSEYKLKNNNEELCKADKQDIFANIKSMFIYKMSSTLLTSIDNIVISILLGTVTVGFYANYQTIVINITGIITILFTSLTASIGNLVIKSTEENRYRVFSTMQMISFWISGVVSVCMYLLIDDFVTLWLGYEYVLGEDITIAITWSFFFTCSMLPLWSFREATGLYNKTKYIMLIASLENLILSIILANLYGLGGIIFATLIARVTTYFWYEPHLLYKSYFGVSEDKYYIAYFINIVMMIVLMEGIKYLLNDFNCENIIQWMIKGIVVFLLSNFIYVMRYLKTNEFKYFLKKIKK